MNIASYFSPEVIVLAFLMTIGLLLFLGRIGVIRNAFDPFMFMHLQLVFTTVLLSWAGLLPLSQVLYLVLVYLVIAACWPKSFRPSTGSDDRGWSFCVWLLVAVSVPANVFLMLTKGFILFQEDVGAAKVEFYQGVGIIRRINTVLSIVLPIYVFTSWSRRGSATATSATRSGRRTPPALAYTRAWRIRSRISFAAAGMLVPGPKIALTPAPFRKS